MTMKLSARTAECLARSGWTSGTAINTEKYESCLKDGGFSVHKAALDFLKKYGGFRIHYPHARVEDMEDEMHFDPLITTRHIHPDKVATYGKIIAKHLCPIGEAARGYLVLMMDENGEVYAGYDDFFAKVGTSGVDAIETLCSGKEMESIQ
jgi:hypothetical protein